MGRGRLSFSFILVLFFGAFLYLQPFAYCKEFRREATCYSDVLHLDCGKLSFIAIHEAYFTTDHHENQTCHSPVPEHEYIEDEDTDSSNYSSCHEDIRISLNRRCSGFKTCNYSYSQQLDKHCFNPEGLFVVHYDCVRDANVNKFCNSKITSGEGYIASPGYPQYYPKLRECSWTVSAADGQTIFLKVLHLHLREASDVTPTLSDPDAFYAMNIQHMTDMMFRCDDDSLTVMEGTTKRFSVCGEEVEALQSAEVDASNGMELRFKTVAFLPASGFLAYYKVQGCPTLAAREGSYLVERNGSAAIYACDNNRVFNDTQESMRFLQCVRDHHWNDTLPSCTVMEETTTTTTTALPNPSTQKDVQNITTAVATNETFILAAWDKNASLVEDIIVPCVLVGVLIFGNIIILVVIFIIRKKQKIHDDEFEDLSEQPKPQQPSHAVEEETNE
ncbi:hypothetical protein HNY73_012464 [Argiope bruennichi]|uniref:CUB domain-containing protein n=1 Tax=Argiope bruennichi TaxID=94029 RepID=A0A8T0EZG9_ARGBR|nr:hypothetical protein HNY73_012464 [Argiope bruennichi]